MTKAKISEYDANAANNTDVNGINIAEGCPPSSMNNMGREIMAALKRFQVGSDGDGVTVGGALVVSGATTANTFSATAVNATGTVTFSGSVILSGTTTANTFSTDLITEKTSAAGVTIDGVLLKDNGVVTGAGTVSAPVYSTTGDLNTGIFFPAADTIAFAEGGAEAMRIDDSGRVGIGNTNAGSYDAVGRNLVIGNASGNTGLTISSGSANSGWILFADGTTGTAPYVGYVEYSHANNTMNFITNAGERGRFVTNGLQVTNCVGVGNTAPSSSGAGITFPATQSASSDANTLDDYEEGSWTPTDASGAGLTLTVTGALYVKIGKQVTAWLWVTYPSTANGSGAVIGGLPFNVGASPMNGAAIAGYTSYTEVVTGIAIYTTSSIELYRDGGTSVTNANLSAKELRMCVTYTV